MGERRFTFKELLDAACKSHTKLWHDDKLNLTQVALFLKRKGHPVSQGTLSRQYRGKHKELSAGTIKAMSLVFGYSSAILRGEPPPKYMDDLLKKYSLPTLMLAERIERLHLRPEIYEALISQITALEEQQEQLERALQQHGSNVSHIDKHR